MRFRSVTPRAVRVQVLVGFFLISGAAGPSVAQGQALPRPPGYQLLDSASGAVLLLRRIPLGKDSASAYLQLVDLHRCSLRQLCMATSNEGLNEGKYFPPGTNSPWFRRFLYTKLDSIPGPPGDSSPFSAGRLFSITNGQFFEQYEESTQLSFPVKLGGKVLTGGSSPYGPTEFPKHAYYRTAQLCALLLFGDSAAITPYNPRSGFPLNRPDIPDAIVSYSYRDHPAKVLGGNPRNRYLLVGLTGRRKVPGRQYLMILSIVGTSLDEGAAAMREAGARGKILTLDGGTSVFLRSRNRGVILRPQAGPAGSSGEPRALPHYLLVFSR